MIGPETQEAIEKPTSDYFVAIFCAGLGAGIDPPYVLGDYRLQYALNDIFTSGVVSVSLGNTTLDHVISGLPSGNFYYMRVFASNYLGESEPSGFLSEHSLGKPSQVQINFWKS